MYIFFTLVHENLILICMCPVYHQMSLISWVWPVWNVAESKEVIACLLWGHSGIRSNLRPGLGLLSKWWWWWTWQWLELESIFQSFWEFLSFSSCCTVSSDTQLTSMQKSIIAVPILLITEHYGESEPEVNLAAICKPCMQFHGVRKKQNMSSKFKVQKPCKSWETHVALCCPGSHFLK